MFVPSNGVMQGGGKRISSTRKIVLGGAKTWSNDIDESLRQRRSL